MKIDQAEFIISSAEASKCPKTHLPEFAFIGRSNVGKSSLINMLTGRNKLAKTSSTPGKTQLINHFFINKNWYLVDLPGYGFAKVSKSDRAKFNKLLTDYLLNRENLVCTFVLIDCRLEPQALDLEFMRWLGENEIPFVIVFTKVDKLKPMEKKKLLVNYEKEMLKEWESMPLHFTTSATHRSGRDEVLDYIDTILEGLK